MPPYMLILDLGFAAYFSAVVSLIDSIADVPAFFALYFPVSWILWLINQRLNMADAEDISFELFIFTMALLVLVMAYDVPECFSGASGSACVEFALLYGGARLLLLAFSAYIGYFLPGVRLMICLEFLGPLGYGSAIGIGLWRLGEGDGQAAIIALLATTAAWDIFLFLAAILLRLQLPKRRVGPIFSRVFPNVHTPLSIPYQEARLERFITISVGNVIASSIARVRALDVPQHLHFAFGAQVVWVGLLIKVSYFDLSAHHEERSGHALRISWQRGVSWTAVHMVIFATIYWLAAAMMDLLSMPWQGIAAERCTHSINFAAALVSYLLCTSLLHMLHRGGHKHRRLSKHKRIALRLVLVAILAVLPVLPCSLHASAGETESPAMPLVLVCSVLMTLFSAVELWGRGLRPTSSADAGDGIGDPQGGAPPTGAELSEGQGRELMRESRHE